MIISKVSFRTGNYKYQLTERVFVQTSIRLDVDIITEYVSLLKNGLMILEKGYAWNGPNFPAIHTERSIIASLPHDGGYQLITLGLLDVKFRINLDWLLGDLVSQPAAGKSLKIFLLNHWRKIRGGYYFTVVDLFGARYAHQGNSLPGIGEKICRI
ncbi:MAG: hypothetical protein K2Q13_04095 [Nitrosomonas sp.]|uniref:hypothetical protein n=1 Tax=Nitrosomonas sp. TaxID=42353 RepID=UPI0025E8EADB|nr:hypothetical protein [Nitrosomonas sp.]MBY0474229.1 hypothetical protein [Nitrosomonas sp.]